MMKYLRLLAALCLFATPAFAQTALSPNLFVTPQFPNQPGYAVLTTPGAGSAVTVYPPAGVTYQNSKGSICNGGWIANNDSATHSVYFYVYDASNVSAANWAMYSIANAGFGSQTQPILNTANIQGAPQDQNSNLTIQVPPGGTVKAAFLTAMGTGGAFIQVTLECAGW